MDQAYTARKRPLIILVCGELTKSKGRSPRGEVLL
jgi:hypothetical protein